MNQLKKKNEFTRGVVTRHGNGNLMVLTKEFVDIVDGREYFKNVWLPIAEGTPVLFENINGVANIVSPHTEIKTKEIDFNINRFIHGSYVKLKMHGTEVKFLTKVELSDQYSDYVLVDVDGDCCMTDWTGTCKVTGSIIQMVVCDYEK
jgi:hypothetical protein